MENEAQDLYAQFLVQWESSGEGLGGAAVALRRLRGSVPPEDLVSLTLEVIARHFTKGKDLDSNIGAGALLLRLVELDQPDEMEALFNAYTRESPWAFKRAIVVALACNTPDATVEARQVARAGLESIMPTLDERDLQLRASARFAYIHACSDVLGVAGAVLSASRLMPVASAFDTRCYAEDLARAIDEGELAYSDGVYVMEQIFMESPNPARELAAQIPDLTENSDFSETFVRILEDAARIL